MLCFFFFALHLMLKGSRREIRLNSLNHSIALKTCKEENQRLKYTKKTTSSWSLAIIYLIGINILTTCKHFQSPNKNLIISLART